MNLQIRLGFAVGRIMLLATVAVLVAQSPPAFEVASIKPHKPGDRHIVLPQFLPGGRFTAAGLPMQIIIAFAYNLPFQGGQLSGGPDWLRSMDNTYDIEARAEADAFQGLSPDESADKKRRMLQQLLAERFNLSIRHSIQEQPVYVLTVAKNGPKLQKSKVEAKDCDEPQSQCHFGGTGQGRGIHVKAFNMTELAVSVSNFTDRPLVDRTGLTGLYDIDTEGWVAMRPRPVSANPNSTAEALADADPTRSTLFMIFDKLGLKMTPSKAPVEVFVIDRVTKPTEN